MGTNASKQQSKQDGHNVSLSHSISMPATNKSRLEAVEGGNKVPWKSKLLSMPKLVNRESSFGNMFRLSSELPLVQEEVIEEFPDSTEEGSWKVRNGKHLRRVVSFQPAWDPSPDRKVAISCKNVKEGASVAENLNSLNTSLKFDPVSDFTGFPCMDAAADRSVGLRSLLNPVLTPSRSFASPSRHACDPKKILTPRRSFNSRNASGSPCMTKFLARSSSFREAPVLNNIQNELQWVSTADSLAEPASSPLFDPLILATFEKALEGLSDESHQSSDSSATDNNSSASESESSSDVDSFQMQKAGVDCFKSSESEGGHGGRILGSPANLRASSYLNRTISFSRVFSLKNDDKNWSGKDYLDRFERICPPAGEGKVILYFTTLRAVRKTFEDCCMLRLILKGLRVHVDERDVWMHSKFRKELTEIMGSSLPVPRLFILGRHIGGAEEVEQLHEEGILEKMLEGLPTEWREACEVCADVRFIPCITCSGSCKTFSEDDIVERCPDCNENGLIMCPSCDW